MLQTILKNNWKLILVFTVVGASACFGLALAKKPVYVADSRLLVRYIQTQGVDAYAASRAAGKIAQIFSEISKTDLFLDKVMATQFAKGLNVPPESDPVARKEFWDNTISVTTGIDSTILRIRAYSGNPKDPKRYVEAVSHVLLTSGEEFHGADGLVSVKLVDSPISFKQSIVPTLAMYSASGLFLGCLIGFLLASLFTAIRFVSVNNKEQQLNSVSESVRQEVTYKESLSQGIQSSIVVDEKPMNTVVEPRSLSQAPKIESRSHAEQEPKLAYTSSQPKETTLRTVFDDLNRLGLDPTKLKFET